MIRLQSNTNSSTSSLANPPQLSPLRRVLQSPLFGRINNSKRGGLYDFDDLKSIDSSDEFRKCDSTPAKKLPSGLLATPQKPSTGSGGTLVEPSLSRLSRSIDQILLDHGFDDDDDILVTNSPTTQPSPPSEDSPVTPPLTPPRRQRRSSLLASTAESYIMSPRHRSQDAVEVSPSSSNQSSPRKSKTGDRLCKTTHPTLKTSSKSSRTTDTLKSRSVHVIGQPPLSSPKSPSRIGRRASISGSSARKVREKPSSGLALTQSAHVSYPGTTDRISSRSAHVPSSASNTERKSPLVGTRKRTTPFILRTRSKLSPKTLSKRLSSLEKVEEVSTEDLSTATPRTSNRKSDGKTVDTATNTHKTLTVKTASIIRPKRRSALYISMYNSFSVPEGEDNGTASPSHSSSSDDFVNDIENDDDDRRLHPYLPDCRPAAHTAWVSSPSGHRRHLEISWE